MDGRRLSGFVVAAFAGWLLAACGGGNNHGETTPATPPTSAPSGSDKFLLFPNPQQRSQSDPSSQIDEAAYAQAYYAAIDPGNVKDTLVKWKAANGFDSGTGTQVTAAFGDQRDLGYGRRMTARRNTDGTIAFLVENYQVDPGGAYGYSAVSLEAAVREDTRWRILVNAIEFSPGPDGGVSFAKFFNFDPATGKRQLTVDLDGRGEKFMPGPCITCHGGRGDALVPDAKPPGMLLFNLVQNAASNTRGDTQGQLAPLEVDSFDFSPLPGYTRSDQEARLKTMNMFVLCSYPRPRSTPTSVSPDFCTRRLANASEWQGTAADLLIQAYGGDLMQSMYSDTLVPAGWQNDMALYRDVVKPSCRGCHILRGTGTGVSTDIDFNSFAKFQGFADRIKAHVIDRGNMPLAKFIYDTFWQPANPGPQALAAFLKNQGFDVQDGAGAVLQPGRPIADPGPDRLVPLGATKLSAAGSLFATAFTWSVLPPANGVVAVLTNADSAQPTFNATAAGTYVLELVASNGAVRSAPARLRLFVSSLPMPRIAFDDIKNALVSNEATCSSCHTPPPNDNVAGPPVFFVGDGGADRTDRNTFYAEVRSRINFADIVASPLLRKPSGFHHNGSQLTGFDSTKDPGEKARDSYDKFLSWILNDAPLN